MPGCSGALERGVAALDQGNLEEAEHQLERAERGSGDAAELRAARAELEVRKAEEATTAAAAESHYRAALRQVPGHEVALVGLGALMLDAGRPGDAIVALRGQDQCGACDALLAAAYFDRGRQGLERGNPDAAIRDLEYALQLDDDPRVLLHIAAAHLAGSQEGPAAALRSLALAARTLPPDDLSAQTRYGQVRRAAVLACARQGGDLTAQALALPAPEGATAEEELDLAFQSEGVRFRHGAPDRALDRATALLAEAGGTLEKERRGQLEHRLAELYAERVAQRLARGEGLEARRTLELGEAATGERAVFTYQDLLVGGLEDPDAALERLAAQKVAPMLGGRNMHRRARLVLETMAAHQAMSDRDRSGAVQHLTQARAIDPDSPAYRVAYARWLAMTPIESLSAEQEKALEDRALVRYSQGRVHRYAEALAHLRAARASLESSVEVNWLVAPSLDTKLAALEADLGGRYPYDVDFHPERKAKLRLVNRGSDPVELEVECPERARTVLVPADGEAVVLIDRPGFTAVRRDGYEKVLVTEPYAQIHVPI